jgi:hypothetical protein
MAWLTKLQLRDEVFGLRNKGSQYKVLLAAPVFVDPKRFLVLVDHVPYKARASASLKFNLGSLLGIVVL